MKLLFFSWKSLSIFSFGFTNYNFFHKVFFFFFLQMFNIIMQLLAAAEHTMTGKNTKNG